MSTTSADQQEPTGDPVGEASSASGQASAAGAADAGMSTTGGGAAGGQQRPRGTVRMLLRETVIVVGMALLLSLVVKTWLLQAFYIPSASMNDTLVKGDRVIVSKLTPGPFDLKRGDIVVFEDPDHWLDPTVQPQRSPVGAAVSKALTFVGLLPNDEGNHLIKRVIGLPGDHVICCNPGGKLTVNGTAITEPYLRPGDPPSLKTFDITVPAGKVWVMGDHRSDSSDSRFHDPAGTGAQGSVPVDHVVGRAVTVVWPLSDWAWLGQPTQTFTGVSARSPASSPSAVPRVSGSSQPAGAPPPGSVPTDTDNPDN